MCEAQEGGEGAQPEEPVRESVPDAGLYIEAQDDMGQVLSAHVR